MKHHFRIISVIITVLLIISVGLNIVLAADTTVEPGSDQDPLVSKSYVDDAIGKVNSALQQLQGLYNALQTENQQIKIKDAEQEQTVKAQQDQIKTLQDQIKTQQDQTKALQDQIKALQDAIKTVQSQPAGNGTAQNAVTGKGTVNTPSLNVRSQANTTSSIVAKVLKGETVTIVIKSGEWYKIKTSKGITGFVLGKYIIVKK